MGLNPDAADSAAVINEMAGQKLSVKSATVVIHPPGDVILEAGEKSLLISSKILSVASPVFRAMFGPYFQEGDALARRYVERKTLINELLP